MTMQRLDALLADSRVGSDREAVADALCELLASSYGGSPQHAVPRSEMAHAVKLIAQVAASIGPQLLHDAARRHALPVALRHWLHGSQAARVGSESVPTSSGDIEVRVAGVMVAALSELTAKIELTRFQAGCLAIDARVSPTHLFGEVTFEAEVAGRRQAVEVTGEYAGFELFGHRFVDGVHLRVLCPDLPEAGSGDIAFRARVTVADRPCSARVRLVYGPYSHLTRARFRYWRAGGVKFTAGADAVSFSRQSGARLVLDEALLIAGLLVSPHADTRRDALTRVAYWMTRGFYRRHPVWLTHDKMYGAGDCGEYMYRYLDAHRAGFVPYYAINADAAETPALRGSGFRLVHPGTMRHRLVYLNARELLTTQANPAGYNGLSGRAGLNLRDLFSARTVCIQHGLTMQDIARITRRSYAGVERYYCASPHEIDNLLQAEYGYSRDQLALTGIPRFDGLHSAPQRRILVAPTWRPDVAATATALNERRPASGAFRETPFFRIYGRLLTDPRLLECARVTGYGVDLVMHPYLASNAGALIEHLGGVSEGADGRGASVRVVVPGIDSAYETLLEQADLMVTDFSGVQYDFAYMGKPVVYFHPPEVPSAYGHGAMDYETMGFGEIATNVDALVDLVCGYMERDCAMTGTYRARIDAFFEYRDHHNCERILADLLAHPSGPQAC